MWPTFVDTLELSGWNSSLEVYKASQEGEILDGILFDKNNPSRVYPIMDGVLDLLNKDLADRDRRAAFFNKYLRSTPGRVMLSEQSATLTHDEEEKLLQRTHHDHVSDTYDRHLSNSPFGCCSDRILFEMWSEYLWQGATVLDLGCGTGRRGIIAAAMTKAPYIGIDISYGMVEHAREKFKNAGMLSQANFCVGDVESTLIKPQTAHVILATGVLHHAASPANLIAQARQALIPGGYLLSYENHDSILRGLFDLLQSISLVWHEQEGAHPIISIADLDRWFSEVGGFHEPEYKYHIYLPPHIFNLAGKTLGYRIMTFSDVLARSIPWLRAQSGIIIIQAQRK